MTYTVQIQHNQHAKLIAMTAIFRHKSVKVTTLLNQLPHRKAMELRCNINEKSTQNQLKINQKSAQNQRKINAKQDNHDIFFLKTHVFICTNRKR